MYARYSAISWGFWRPVTLSFDLFNWKLALHLLVLWETFIPILIFLRFFFCFRVTSPYGTDRRVRRVMRPIKRPHSNRTSLFHSLFACPASIVFSVKRRNFRNYRLNIFVTAELYVLKTAPPPVIMIRMYAALYSLLHNTVALPGECNCVELPNA